MNCCRERLASVGAVQRKSMGQGRGEPFSTGVYFRRVVVRQADGLVAETLSTVYGHHETRWALLVGAFCFGRFAFCLWKKTCCSNSSSELFLWSAPIVLFPTRYTAIFPCYEYQYFFSFTGVRSFFQDAESTVTYQP